MWLACKFGLAAPSLVLPREFRRLRVLSRPADGCARLRNRVHKILDRGGIGGVLSDVFGVTGMRILHGAIPIPQLNDLFLRGLQQPILVAHKRVQSFVIQVT